MARKRTSTPGPYLHHLEKDPERIWKPNDYPWSLPVVRHLTRLSFHPNVTFLIGENGSGKSTLLEAIAVLLGLNPEGGSLNFCFSTCESHSKLDDCLRLAQIPGQPADTYFLRAESFYNVATEIENLDQDPCGGPKVIGSYGGVSLHEQSHGESFLSLFKHRFGGHGLYLLDEPEAALSPQRQLQFLALLHDYCSRGSQFVIATHSLIIMAYPDAVIHHFAEDGIREVPYLETEHYRVTRGFLSNPKRSLDELMNSG